MNRVNGRSGHRTIENRVIPDLHNWFPEIAPQSEQWRNS
jgi:hypothetical protein